MQIYLIVDGAKQGPFTLFHIEERLRAGEIDETTKAWHEGLDGWKPMAELPAFERYFERKVEERHRVERPRPQRIDAPKELEPDPSLAPRPWTRFWARSLDQFFFMCLCLAVLMILRQAGWATVDYLDFWQNVLLFLMIGWHLIEAFMITQWATTPGKYLLGIKVTDAEGNHLQYGASLRRTFGVYVLGLGGFLPFIHIITQVLAYRILKKRGVTVWDAGVGCQVHHQAFQPRHVFIPLLLVLLCYSLLQKPFEVVGDQYRQEMEEAFGVKKSQSNDRPSEVSPDSSEDGPNEEPPVELEPETN